MGRRARPAQLASKLLAIRKKLGISQIKMAKLLNVGAYHRLSEFESGRREPDLKVLLRYAQAAGISVESIIDDELDLPF